MKMSILSGLSSSPEACWSSALCKPIESSFCGHSLVCFGKPLRKHETHLSGHDLTQMDNYRGFETFKFHNIIEGFEECDRIFEGIQCEKLKLSQTKLSKLSPQILELAKRAIQLEIDHNQLTHLDEDLIGSCTNLRALSMINTCSPDTKFSLGFLTSLTKLTRLRDHFARRTSRFRSVPELEVAFNAYSEGSLKHRRQQNEKNQAHQGRFRSTIQSASPGVTLTCPALRSTHLTKTCLQDSRSSRHLNLEQNMISHIHVDAFNNCPSHLRMPLVYAITK